MFVRLRQNELTRSRGGVRDASRGLYPVISKEAVLRNKERGPEHAWLTNSKLKHLLHLTCHMDIKNEFHYEKNAHAIYRDFLSCRKDNFR